MHDQWQALRVPRRGGTVLLTDPESSRAMALQDATPAKTVRAWATSMRIIARYFASRCGLGKPVPITDHWNVVQLFFRQVTGMDRRIRVRGMEHCPQSHPAIFAANHVKLDDPFYCCYAVQEATALRMHARFVMRDDFFDAPFWKRMPFDINEIAQLGGAYLVSLDHAQFSQLKPLLELLARPFSFIIFPGRSRTRSGLVMDYRPGYEEPGAVSFFVAHAQRRGPGQSVPVAPLARTFNPITGVSAVVFGPALTLAAGADRIAQRAFDEELSTRIGDLVEINVLHLVSLLVYVRLVHHRPPALSRMHLETACRHLHRNLSERWTDPALDQDFSGQMKAALRYLEKTGMVVCSADTVQVQEDAVAHLPDLDTGFRTRNPVRFHANQVLHLADVVTAAEAAARF